MCVFICDLFVWSYISYIDTKIKFTLFSKSQQSVKLKLYENEIVILEKKVDLKKGFQNIELDSSYSDKAISTVYKDNKKNELKKSDNGKYYFKKGKFILKIGDYSGSFQIK